MPGGSVLGAVLVVASAATIASVLILAIKPILIRYLLAHPNARSSHRNATPQGAGIAVIVALLLVFGAASLMIGQTDAAEALLPVLMAALGLAVLGLADDARALPVSWRFAGQLAAAMLMLLSLPETLHLFPELLPSPIERTLLVVGAVWFVNAVNFLDGIDWITAAQVAPMTLGIAAIAWLGAAPTSVGLLSLALLGAMIGFAIFNKYPAQVFLGDAGSLPIGLLLAFMLIVVAASDVVSALLLAFYTLADSTITLLRRAANREPLFAAHRQHFYQQAIIKGMTPPQVTARIFLLELLLAGLALAAAAAPSLRIDLILLGLGAAATGLLLAWLARRGAPQPAGGTSDR